MSHIPKLLLTDATMPVNFCEAGATCGMAMLDYLGEALHMVREVEGELERKAKRIPALQRFLDEFPDERVRHLDLELVTEVALVKKVVQVPGAHADEDAGEIASVLYAAHRRELGKTFTVVTDDNEGKNLARDRKLTVLTTQALVHQMVCRGSSRICGRRSNLAPLLHQSAEVEGLTRAHPERLSRAPASRPRAGQGAG